jgi:hypothetical protein
VCCSIDSAVSTDQEPLVGQAQSPQELPEHLLSLYEDPVLNLDIEQVSKVKQLLVENKDMFTVESPTSHLGV